jgi:hypothetical protein
MTEGHMTTIGPSLNPVSRSAASMQRLEADTPPSAARPSAAQAARESAASSDPSSNRRFEEIARSFKSAAEHASGPTRRDAARMAAMTRALDSLRTFSEQIGSARAIYLFGSGGPSSLNGSAVPDSPFAVDRTERGVVYQGGDGADEITVSEGPVDRLSAGDGDDVVSVSVGRIGTVSGGAGDDAVSVQTRNAEVVSGGAGDDAVTVDAEGHVGFVIGGDGADKISTVAQEVRNVQGGRGSDVIDVDAEIVGRVSGGAGDDIIDAEGAEIRRVRGGFGDDEMSVAAESVGRVAGGEGADRIDVTAAHVEKVGGGQGDDVLTVSASVAEAVRGGKGDDTITVQAMAATVVGGAGDDVVDLDADYAEMKFAVGDGQDSVTLGEGTALAVDLGDGLLYADATIEPVGEESAPTGAVVSFASGERIEIAGLDTAAAVSLRFADGEIVVLKAPVAAPASEIGESPLAEAERPAAPAASTTEADGTQAVEAGFDSNVGAAAQAALSADLAAKSADPFDRRV